MAKIILIRGNSGSGKTTVARKLHSLLGEGNLLISQDVVRREMLNVPDKPDNLAIGLIKMMIEYGKGNCEFVIIEGILAKSKYGDMLREVLVNCDNVFTYYYDLTFEQTLIRHHTKCNPGFAEKTMRSWFLEKDLLGIENEQSITNDVSVDGMIALIMADLDKK
ncbi:AAA family ATPase [Listeria costaricensis]|uniref:AAA family ATPase n=1 Tax=Listeria costaricensis TaxID=2026604 RepID=UPI000C0774C7|nr:AAA family ATPase [Listeria costaricensis]